jgi:hypothetical protein
MKESKELNVTKRTVALAFKEFREIIYKYLTLVYHTEILGDTNMEFISLQTKLYSVI